MNIALSDDVALGSYINILPQVVLDISIGIGTGRVPIRDLGA